VVVNDYNTLIQLAMVCRMEDHKMFRVLNMKYPISKEKGISDAADTNACNGSNPTAKILPGMFIRAIIVLARINPFICPSQIEQRS